MADLHHASRCLPCCTLLACPCRQGLPAPHIHLPPSPLAAIASPAGVPQAAWTCGQPWQRCTGGRGGRQRRRRSGSMPATASLWDAASIRTQIGSTGSGGSPAVFCPLCLWVGGAWAFGAWARCLYRVGALWHCITIAVPCRLPPPPVQALAPSHVRLSPQLPAAEEQRTAGAVAAITAQRRAASSSGPVWWPKRRALVAPELEGPLWQQLAPSVCACAGGSSAASLRRFLSIFHIHSPRHFFIVTCVAIQTAAPFWRESAA